MLKRLAAYLGLALVVGVLSPGLRAQTPDETIRVKTDFVSVPVIVSDRDGRYIPNLKREDFSVFQDGSQQTIDFFAATEEPITVALLVDTSQSTRNVLDDIKESAKSFIKLLRPADRAMIVSFDYDIHVLSQLTSDQDQLKRAVKSAEIPDRLVGTVLRDAAFQTVNRSFAGIKGRKAIIILTDGKDFGSRTTTQALLYSLQESDTLVYTIMFTTEDPAQALRQQRQGGRRGGGGFPGGGGRFPGGGGRFPGGGGRFPGGGGRGGGFPDRRDNPQRTARMERENEEAADFLRELSETTAGRFYSSNDGKLKKTFASIVDELRYQYRLGFYPPEETGGDRLHTVKIKVSTPDAVVRARTGYRSQAK